MEEYIQRLIEDIGKANERAASMNEEVDEVFDPGRYVDFDFLDEHQRPLSEYIGFVPSEFPERDLLSDVQIKLIVDGLFELYLAYGISLILPDELPVRDQYLFYIRALDELIFVDHQTSIGIEFCEYDPDSCPFGAEYCTCKEFFDKEESDEDRQLRYMLKQLETEEIPVKSRYAQQLIEDIHAAFIPYKESGILLDLDFFIPDFDDLPFGDQKKPIFEWIGMDAALFPPADKLLPLDALAIVNTLLNYWDDSNPPILLMNLIESPGMKYSLAVDMFSTEMRYDGQSCFYLEKPSQEKLKSVLDDFPDLKVILSDYFDQDGFFD